MAEEIIIGVKIETGEAAKSLSDLKKEYKEQQTALSGMTVGTAEYVAQLKKLGATKDDIGDLNATIKAFNPEGKVQVFGNVVSGLASGFQAATGAASLFGGSSKEVEKQLLKVQAVMAFTEGIKGLASLGDGFKVPGTVIKSNPLYLIGAVIVGIGTALFALKDKIGIVGDAFDAIGKAISWVYDKVTAFTDAIGLTSVAFDKANDSIIENTKKATEAINSRYDGEIAAAKRSHKETVFLEIEKSKAILESNKLAIDAINRRRLANGTLNEEDAKALLELQKNNSEAYKNISDSWANYKDQQLEKSKQSNEEFKKLQEDRIKASGEAWMREEEAKAKREEDEITRQEQASANEAARVQMEGEAWLKEIETKQFQEDEKLRIEQDASDQRAKMLADEQALKKQHYEQTIQGATAVLQATQALTELGFANQLRMAKGNAAEERKIRKKQFNVNKAFGIANSVIDGVQAVQKALNNPYPLNIVLAVASGLLATANTVKIATTKFDDGGGGAGGGGGQAGASFGSLGSASNGAPVNAPSTASTSLNADGTVKKATEASKVYVVESDITSKQKTVATIEQNAKV